MLAAIAALVGGCSEQDAPKAPEKPSLERFVALSKAAARQSILDDLRMPPQERERLHAIAVADPAQILFLTNQVLVDEEEAKVLAGYPGKVILLPNVLAIAPEAAAALAKWPGEMLFLGLYEPSREVAAALAGWRGKSLHLDDVQKLAPDAAAELAKWPGGVLGLAKLEPGAETAQALGAFKGTVAITVTPPRKEPPPPRMDADTRATLVQLVKMIRTDDVDGVRAYLRGGGAPDLNERGTTLLMEAVNFKHVEIAKVLLEGHADVNAVNGEGLTPLYYALNRFAARDSEPDDAKEASALVHLLVDAGARLGAPSQAGDMYKPPLAQAAARGDADLVAFLLAKGADPKAADPNGVTALVEAVDAAQARVAKLLIDAGAEVNPKNPGPGRSPIHQAISQGAMAIFMFTFRAKDAHESPDPVRLAALVKKWTDVFDVLVAGGADLSARDDRGGTPLEAAINGGSLEILTRVLDAKPKLDERDAHGATPLMFLADLRRLEEPDLVPIAELLLARGADRAAKSGDGLTAAEIAEKRGCHALAAALR
jgi:ankyrin repeat protein